jgi:hypothetical protein
MVDRSAVLIGVDEFASKQKDDVEEEKTKTIGRSTGVVIAY